MESGGDQPPARQIPWWGWVTTGALATGAAIAGGLAITTSRELQDRREGFPLTPGELDDSGARARGLAMASDGLLVGAVVAAAASLYFTLRVPRRQPAAGRGRPRE